MAKANYTVEDIKRIAKDENVRFLDRKSVV